MRVFYMRRGEMSGSAAVYSLLRYAFRKIYGEALPEIKKTPNGKPFFPSRPDIQFSLSHSVTHVLCALSGVPVGVDIESPRVLRPRTINYFSSPEERELFDPLELWVLKESYIKLYGLTLPSVKTIRFSRVGNAITAPEQQIMPKLYHAGNCVAAVCSLGETPPDEIEIVEKSAL